MGIILSINVSKKKGCRKKRVEKARVNEYGIEGDAHAGKGLRQMSFLTLESIEKMRKKGYNIQYGELAENITLGGISPNDIKVGKKLKIGKEVIVEITKIGKDCKEDCSLFKGHFEDCMMAKEGFFAKVIRGGEIKIGDAVEIT